MNPPETSGITHPYCAGPNRDGLTCDRSQLALIRILDQQDTPTVEKLEAVYRCPTCGGLYKYRYYNSYRYRNFDEDEGWFLLEDHYFKVGEHMGALTPFSEAQAALYWPVPPNSAPTESS